VVHNKEELDQAALPLRFPLIVKPELCSSSFGQTVVNDMEELKAAFSEASANSRNGSVCVEEFIEHKSLRARELDVFLLGDEIIWDGLRDSYRVEKAPLRPIYDVYPAELTEEEAINFPQKNVITRAMMPNLERRHKADIYSFADIKQGDYFFLCCDGVLEQLTNDRLCEILSDKKLSDNQKLDAIKQVCDGKTKDNYTCYLVPIDNVILEKDDVKSENEDMIAGVELDVEEELILPQKQKGGIKGFFCRLWNLKKRK
jgi:hypothetical protein